MAGEPSCGEIVGGTATRYRRRFNVRLVTARGYHDIWVQYVPGREVYEAIAQWGGLTDTVRIGEREYRCRAGWSPQEFWRRIEDGR